MATTYVCERSQKARRGRTGHYGPDRYVAVQVVPDGVQPLRVLRRDFARKRGIRIEYLGEGYSEYRGPRSSLGRALAEATAYARANGEYQGRM